MSERPYIHVNVAMSADGKIDSIARKDMSISSPADRRRVDELRSSVDAILVGGRTLFDEDPKLNVTSNELRKARTLRGLPEDPIKVGVASKLRIEGGERNASQLPLEEFLSAGCGRCMIFTTKQTMPDVIDMYRNAGVEVVISAGQRVDLLAMIDSLSSLGITRMLVEGGGTIIAEFFRLNLVDELSIYIAPKIIGGISAPSMVDGAGVIPGFPARLCLKTARQFDSEGGVLLEFKIDYP